jgi:hypothetical protein
MFTAAKLKLMLESLNPVVENLVRHLEEEVRSGSRVLKLRNLFETFALESIAATTFGIKILSQENCQASIVALS